jgi:hypothetical protein
MQCGAQAVDSMGVQCREARSWWSVISKQNRLKQARYVEDCACRNNPRNPNELKTSMSNIIARISHATLQAVSRNMLRRAWLCVQHASAHF